MALPLETSSGSEYIRSRQMPLASTQAAEIGKGVGSATITGNRFAGGSGERAFNDGGGNSSSFTLSGVLKHNRFDPSGVIDTEEAETTERNRPPLKTVASSGGTVRTPYHRSNYW